MKNRKTLFVIILLSFFLLAAFVLAQQMLRKDSIIKLPQSATETDVGEDTPGTDDSNVLSITPGTVQTAIATLSRPAAYHRTQTVEIFWTGGSSSSAAQIAVSGGTTRIDTTLSDGSICHILVVGSHCAVWYDDEQTWITLRADHFSSDALQRMPTYETVLDLPVESIDRAEYCVKDDVYCIYVRTTEDADGYAASYWISVRSGLLFSAERTCNGELIYRFSASEPGAEAPTESLFLLPDGSKFQP